MFFFFLFCFSFAFSLRFQFFFVFLNSISPKSLFIFMKCPSFHLLSMGGSGGGGGDENANGDLYISSFPNIYMHWKSQPDLLMPTKWGLTFHKRIWNLVFPATKSGKGRFKKETINLHSIRLMVNAMFRGNVNLFKWKIFPASFRTTSATIITMIK